MLVSRLQKELNPQMIARKLLILIYLLQPKNLNCICLRAQKFRFFAILNLNDSVFKMGTMTCTELAFKLCSSRGCFLINKLKWERACNSFKTVFGSIDCNLIKISLHSSSICTKWLISSFIIAEINKHLVSIERVAALMHVSNSYNDDGALRGRLLI